MRVLDGDQFLVHIFLGESDQWQHTPLSRALLERLRAEGFAGATVVHGVAGFGADSVIHTAGLIELSTDLPVVIEVRARAQLNVGTTCNAMRAPVPHVLIGVSKTSRS